VLRYGNARELCLGLEVVTPQGEVWNGLSGLRKDNTGYDLRDLFIGSEGTLGIITAATLKLFPRPGAVMTALATCDSIDAAVRLLGLARQQLGAGLTGFEVMERFALTLVHKHFPQLPRALPEAPWTVLLELADRDEQQAREQLEALLGAALEAGVIADAAVAESLAQARALWHVRESISLAQAEEGLNIKHDIALPVSAIPAFIAQTDAVLRALLPGIRLVTFGHLGDGNLHYNVQAPEGGSPAAFLRDHEARVNALVYDAVQGFDGSISAEHGIGGLKREELALRKPAVAMGMMRALKAALDPAQVLKRGLSVARAFQPGGQRQGHDLNAFFTQFGPLLGRGLAADAARLRFPVVDLAGLLGEALAHVFGLFQHLAHRVHPARLQGPRGIGRRRLGCRVG
jgi:FAD/FMN-containing dehydrogenase